MAGSTFQTNPFVGDDKDTIESDLKISVAI